MPKMAVLDRVLAVLGVLIVAGTLGAFLGW